MLWYLEAENSQLVGGGTAFSCKANFGSSRARTILFVSLQTNRKNSNDLSQ